MNTSHTKKIITLLIIIGMFAPYAAFADPFSGIDPVNSAAEAIKIPLEVTQEEIAVKDNIKEFALNPIASAVAALLGEKLATLIVNKVNGGASSDKDPDYVTSFSDYFKNIQQGETSKFLAELQTNSGNNPYVKDIVAKLSRNYANGSNSSRLNAFNLDKVIGPDYKSFATDATKGGWQGYIAIALPQNNPYGSELLANEELGNKVASKVQEETLKLTSSGFKPSSTCDATLDSYKDRLKDVSTRAANSATNSTMNNALQNANPDTLSQDLANLRAQQADAIAKYGDNSPEANAADAAYYERSAAFKDGATQVIDANNAENTANSYAIGNGFSSLTEDTLYCVEESIKNPSSLIQASVSTATNYALDATKGLKEWQQVLANSFISLASSFIKTGLASLKIDGAKTSKEIGGPEQLVTTNGQSIQWSSAPKKIVDLPVELPRAYKNSAEELKLLNQSKKLLQQTPVQIAILDMCIPGPDFRSPERLQKYFDDHTKKIQQKALMSKGSENKINLRSDTYAYLQQGIASAKQEMELLTSYPDRNIPGSQIMQSYVSKFDEKKRMYIKTKENIVDRSISIAIITQIRNDVAATLRLLRREPNFGTTAPFDNVVLMKQDWDRLNPAQKKALYEWAQQYQPKTPVVKPATVKKSVTKNSTSSR